MMAGEQPHLYVCECIFDNTISWHKHRRIVNSLMMKVCFFYLYTLRFGGVIVLIILLVLCVFLNTCWLWPLSLTCAEAPKPHVNSDSGGLWDSGSCCLSAQWKERLSCNGPPVGSVCKLLCAAAVWGLPSELHIAVFFWLASSVGGYHRFCQGESVLSLHTLPEMRQQRSPKRSSSLLGVKYIQLPKL